MQLSEQSSLLLHGEEAEKRLKAIYVGGSYGMRLTALSSV